MPTSHPRASPEMTTDAATPTRRLRAALIGLGLDDPQGPRRIISGQDCGVIVGSTRTQAERLETMLRLESELERIGQTLGELSPAKLAEVAWRIDSPELQEIALRLESGLTRLGRTFEQSSPE